MEQEANRVPESHLTEDLRELRAAVGLEERESTSPEIAVERAR